MEVSTYALGALQTNCYIVEKNEHVLIIDPGDSADFISEKIQINRLRVDGILATHGHYDHVLVAAELSLNFSVPLTINIKDQFLLDRLYTTASHFLKYTVPVIPLNNVKNIFIGEGSIGLFGFRSIPVPGHTPGSMAYYFPDEQTLFSGDTLFYHAVGAWNHTYSNREDVQRSVKKLLQLPEETIVYSGHGELTTVREEKNNQTDKVFFS